MISIRQTGAQDASLQLQQLVRELDQPRSLLGGLLDDIFEVQREWWNTDGRGTWAPDKPSTLAEDRASGDSTQLMHDSGALAAASTHRGGSGQDISYGPDSLTFTVTMPYAEPLAKAGRGAVVDPTSKDAEKFAEAFLRELQHA